MPVRLITFPVDERRFNEVLDAQGLFQADMDYWAANPHERPWATAVTEPVKPVKPAETAETVKPAAPVQAGQNGGVRWRIVSEILEPGGDPGDTLILVHRPTTGGVALIYRDGTCAGHCVTAPEHLEDDDEQAGCPDCMFVCRIETTLLHLLHGIERALAQGIQLFSWVNPPAEVEFLRAVLVGLYDQSDPEEASERLVVALGGPVSTPPRAAF